MAYATATDVKAMNSAIGYSIADSAIGDLIDAASAQIDFFTGKTAGYFSTLDAVPPEVKQAVIYLVLAQWRSIMAAGLDSEGVFGRSYKLDNPDQVIRRLRLLLNKWGFDTAKYNWEGWAAWGGNVQWWWSLTS